MPASRICKPALRPIFRIRLVCRKHLSRSCLPYQECKSAGEQIGRQSTISNRWGSLTFPYISRKSMHSIHFHNSTNKWKILIPEYIVHLTTFLSILNYNSLTSSWLLSYQRNELIFGTFLIWWSVSKLLYMRSKTLKCSTLQPLSP